MRDSLKLDPKKGAVVQKKYKGTIPAADGPGIVYDLTLFYQQDMMTAFMNWTPLIWKPKTAKTRHSLLPVNAK